MLLSTKTVLICFISILGLGNGSRHSSVTSYETDEHETMICILCRQAQKDFNALKEEPNGKVPKDFTLQYSQQFIFPKG